MVSGPLRFTGEWVLDIIKQHCFDPVPPLAVLRADIPPMLVAVVERALAKTAGERFASVTEFSEAFTKAARGELRALPPRATPAERAARLRPKARGRIAAIDSLGMVTALAPGTVVGRATRDGLSDSAVIRVSAGATAAANRAPRNARLVLRGVRPGSSIVLDGQTTNDTALSLRPGERHVVFVILDGYVTWLDTLRPRQGEQLTATVQQRVPPVARAAPPAPGLLPPCTPAPADLT